MKEKIIIGTSRREKDTCQAVHRVIQMGRPFREKTWNVGFLLVSA